MGKNPEGVTSRRRQRRALTWALHCRRAKHTRERTRARASAQTKPRTNTSAQAQSQAAQFERSRARAAQNEPPTTPDVRGNRRQRPGPVSRASPTKVAARPRGEMTANIPLTAPMLLGTKTSTRQTRRGKTGTGVPQAKTPRRRQGQGQQKELGGIPHPIQAEGWSLAAANSTPGGGLVPCRRAA